MEPVEVETVRFEVDAVSPSRATDSPPRSVGRPLSVTPTRSAAARQGCGRRSAAGARRRRLGRAPLRLPRRGRFDWQPRWRDTRAAGCAGGDRRCRRRSTCDRRRVQLRSRCRALGDDPRISRWITVAPVLSIFTEFAAAHDARPKTLIAAAHDQFRPAAELSSAVDAGGPRRRGGEGRSLLPRCPARRSSTRSAPSSPDQAAGGRTVTPASSIKAFASPTVCSPKWKMLAPAIGATLRDAFDEMLECADASRAMTGTSTAS